MRICVLGTYPLTGDGPKIGTQHIAETLVRLGHEVLYLTAQASWFALFDARYRAKYLSTFRPTRIGERLTQATPVKLVPMRVLKQVEGTPLHRPVLWLNTRAERVRGRVLDPEFDLCIFSAAPTITVLHRVRARRYLYRVNDLLSGFSVLPKSVIEFEDHVLRTYPIASVCAVNQQIANHLRSRYPNLNYRVIPNGVDLPLFRSAEPDPVLAPSRSSNVIYVGSFEAWTDVDLVLDTARLLRDHSFHLFGNWIREVPTSLPSNVYVHGPIQHRAIAGKMKACSVGLIPSAPQNVERMVEKPLKFYEYLAAGLGVAATRFGGKDLAPFAALGDDPAALAGAIEQAKSIPARYAAQIKETVRALSWENLVSQMLEGVA